jgi:hypothetical protein
MDLIWGMASSSSVQQEGLTALRTRLAIVDWTGLVWTGPNTVVFINSKVDQKTKEVRW